MARQLMKNANGNLRFVEKVFDDDEEDVSHPLSLLVELDEIDGQPVSGPGRTPDWLRATVSELGVVAAEERWEEEVTVTIQNPDQNLEADTLYQFLFRATDGTDTSDHYVTLQVD
jgi:hypothetical protein